jgi:DNA-binding MarR family transcriptional regulator
MQELADSVHLSQSALSRLIGRLEKDGFVARALCANDRRGIYACLTAPGRHLVEQAEPTQNQILAATLETHHQRA